MDSYDSDSSLDEDFTDTGVLLGYAAEEVIEDTISHLGGWPVRSTHRLQTLKPKNLKLTIP
jgi:hypothetical protein